MHANTCGMQWSIAIIYGVGKVVITPPNYKPCGCCKCYVSDLIH